MSTGCARYRGLDARARARGLRPCSRSPQVADIVYHSRGLQRTKELAEAHIDKAISAVQQLQPTPHRQGLVDLAMMVLTRDR